MGLEKRRDQTLAAYVPHTRHVPPHASHTPPPFHLTTARGVVAPLHVSGRETRVSLGMENLPEEVLLLST